jgi:hypothetical protein
MDGLTGPLESADLPVLGSGRGVVPLGGVGTVQLSSVLGWLGVVTG